MKHPIKIGHSWGLLFPKAISRIFAPDQKSAEVKLRPQVKEGKIELLVG